MNELLRRLLFLPDQASSIAPRIDALHYVVIGTTLIGATAVAGIAAWFLHRFRERSGRAGSQRPDERPRHSPGGIPLSGEIVAIGGLLALFVGFWVVGFRQFVDLRTPPPGALEIYVTGKQWMWSFAYPGGGGSEGVLYVPVGRPVKLLLTSRDVIHSFFVPAFRVKHDALPGRMTSIWFEARKPGRWPAFCTEYCGLDHSHMRAFVVAVPADEFELRTHAGSEQLVSVGARTAAERGCLRCHTVDGTPYIAPTWAGLYRSVVRLSTGATVVADEEYLTASMMDPLAAIHAGFAPIMPSYRGLLTSTETAALVEYIRSLQSLPEETFRSPPPRTERGR